MSQPGRKAERRDEVLAIIPARGGSKGIPRKNTQVLGGRPLLSYSIEHARSTPAITRVVVSTDDAEIATIARNCGAEVIWRPEELSGDTATSESALLHALDTLRETEGYEPALVVFLQATSPLRQPDDIQRAIQTLQEEQADSLFSGVASHGFVWRKGREGFSSLTYDYRKRPRRQEVPQDVVENGSIYVFKPWVLRQLNNRLGGKIAIYPMAITDSFQVDEADDLNLMERLLSARRPSDRGEDLSRVRLLVLDFDGVMTDNRVLVDAEGREAAWCHRGDGWGIARLKEAGIEVAVISTEAVPVASARCRKLGIECVQACADKLAALKEVVQRRSLSPEQVAYVGNDMNDLECLRWVGLPIAVGDAVAEVRAVARMTTRRSGGEGAVREVADALLGAAARHAGVVDLPVKPEKSGDVEPGGEAAREQRRSARSRGEAG